jgi:phosphoribosyl 1,2-cyclic phosphodiesterase
MSMRFTVLASGSAGNASLLEAGQFGLLIDAGLGPRQLGQRLSAIGASWDRVQAVLLTHTHTDHWNDRTLAYLQRRGIAYYCHAEHHAALRRYALSFAPLAAAGLVKQFEAGQPICFNGGLTCVPFPVRHDGGATFGFRFAAAPDLFGGTSSLAYLADVGSWDDELAAALADVDVLALEFNHDVALEYASGRNMRLISRVLGDEGHLSNEQAAGLLRAVLNLSAPGRLRHVVQLHLSRDCNRPNLAYASARLILDAAGHTATEVHTATQDEPLAGLLVGNVQPTASAKRGINSRRRMRAGKTLLQCWLPGLEPDGL